MIRAYEHHWFQLTRPAIKPVFQIGGVTFEGSFRLTSRHCVTDVFFHGKPKPPLRWIGRGEACMAALVTVVAGDCYRWFFGTTLQPGKQKAKRSHIPRLFFTSKKKTLKKQFNPQIKCVEGGIKLWAFGQMIHQKVPIFPGPSSNIYRCVHVVKTWNVWRILRF